MDKNLNFTGNQAVSNSTDEHRARCLLFGEGGKKIKPTLFVIKVSSKDGLPVYERAREVILFVKEQGAEAPFAAKDDYTIDLAYIAVDDRDLGEDLYEEARTAVYKTISMLFSDAHATVEKAEEVEITGRLFDGIPGLLAVQDLDAISCYYPRTPEKPHVANIYDPQSFSVAGFCKKHGIPYEEIQGDDVVKYKLLRNPFNGEETAGSFIYVRQAQGGPCIGFHSVDRGFTGKTWTDLRQKLEPDPEEEPMLSSRDRAFKPYITAAPSESGARMLNVAKIPRKKLPPAVTTGFQTLDDLLRGGLRAGELTIVTGIPGSGKSVLLSQVMITMAEHGTSVGCFSGELTQERFQEWMFTQCAGPHTVKDAAGKWYVTDETWEKIAAWMDGRIWLYDNISGGMNSHTVISTLETSISSHGNGFLVIDNMMMLDCGTGGSTFEELREQTKLISALSQLAKKYNIHIILVAHPRKQTGFLSAYDISGSANILNLADNVFSVHRVDDNFLDQAPKAYKLEEDSELFDCDNAIQVLKNREEGLRGDFVGLLYEPHCKSFVDYNYQGRIVHAWEMMAKPAKVEPEAQS